MLLLSVIQVEREVCGGSCDEVMTSTNFEGVRTVVYASRRDEMVV
jgi:hypothetical protein